MSDSPNQSAVLGLSGFFETLRSVFAEPALLPLAAVLAALVMALGLFAVRLTTRERDTLISPALAARAGLRKGLASRRVAIGLAALLALALGLAFARPRWGSISEKAERRGTDVVIVLDTSASMRAADVSPSRFVLARQAAASLLTRLPGDRFGLVACEGEAQVLVPLTLDVAAAALFLDALEPGIGAKPGTSLAAGIGAAAELFPAGGTSGRHCVVISDGEDLEGGVDRAIEKAKKEGIVVHTVFVGASSGSGSPVPELDVAGRMTGYKTDSAGAPILSKPDPALLRSLAAKTSGSFSVVTTGKTDLVGVATTIDKSARRPTAEVLTTNLEERFQIPLGVAVLACGLLLLGISRFEPAG